jgi:two-component system OmpR family sensor kinase/two-component system sensor histidine kinase QseC
MNRDRAGVHSLRLRLFTFIVALAALAALVVAAATYVSVRAEADELFDYQLRQMALSLRDQGRISEAERAALANPEFDYVVQIWSVDGVALYSSAAPPLSEPLPARTVLGFSDLRLAGTTWRVFGAATSQRVVQVAQPLAVRQRLAASAAARSVLPIVVAVPPVGLALWWLVGLSLAPLRRVADAALARQAASLEPLPADGLPAEVVPLVSSFNGLLARLADAFQSQRAFVADAAHELRTPLTALKLQLGLLRDAVDSTERDSALARMRSGIDRATHMVEQLLALARAEPGTATSHVALDLCALARQAIADAAALAAARRASVELKAPDSIVLPGDAQALRSLLRNLVDNAITHAGDAPRVLVTLENAADHVMLRVDDNGPGIPAAERERVFDRFHRREGSSSDGSGLGLAIVRAIARQHNAPVGLDDSPLGGLRVWVRLPLGPVQGPA